MARARNIKPSFFQNEELAELSPITRLSFIGMWTIADFKGCIEFRPKRLKVQLMPYDDCDFEEIAINLERSGLIRIYSVAGRQYIKIINFEKHQNPHKNERESGSDIPDYEPEAASSKAFQGIGINPDKDGTAPADSLLLIPSSLIPDSGFIDSLIPDSPKGCAAASDDAPPKKSSAAKPESKTAGIWSAYAFAYQDQYHVEPVRNAKVNGQLSQVIDRIGAEEAPHVAAFYVRHKNAFYVRKMHSVDALLSDCEKLRTEWATQTQMTQTKAMQADKTQTNFDAFAPLIAEAEERERGHG